MAITKQQAETLDAFHVVDYAYSPLNTDPKACRVWRRNGNTRTWKRDPDRYEVPVKFGLRHYDTLTQDHVPSRIFAPSDCPACHGSKP